MKRMIHTLLSTAVLLAVITLTGYSQQWTQMTSGTGDNLRAVYFVNEQVGYVVGANGYIGKTTNGGVDWVGQHYDAGNELTDVSFLNEERGYAVGWSGYVLFTTNGGADWTKQTTNYSSFDFSGVDIVDDTTAFITCGDIYQDGKILRTTNSGTTWGQRHSTVYMRGLYAHSTTHVFAVGGGTLSSKIGVYRKTTNAGLDWTGPSTAGIDRPTSVFFLDDSIGYIAGFSGTMNKTTNGGTTWTSLTTGTTIAPFSKIWFSSPSNGYATAGNILYTDKGIYTTTNSGESWSKDSIPVDKKMFGVHGVNDNVVFAVGEHGTILKKGAGPVSSVPVAAFAANKVTGSAPLTVQFTDNTTGVPVSWYWTFGDGGNSTEQHPSHTYTAAGTYTVVLNVNNGLGSDDETKTDYIVVTASGTSNGASIPYSQSFDAEWQDKDDTRDVPASYWKNTPATGSHSWSRDDDGLLRNAWFGTSGDYSPAGANSTSHSARFHTFGAEEDSAGMLDLAIDFSTASGSSTLTFYYINETGDDKLEVHVYLDNTEYFTTSYGTTNGWTEAVINLGPITSPNGVIRFKAISDYGIDDIGLDEVRVTGATTSVSEKQTLPTEFGVGQNYPNPFNPSTTLRYNIAARSAVVLHIFNVIGQEVAQFNEGLKEAGSYSLHWNASNLPSGVYYLSMHATAAEQGGTTFRAVRKMLLMK